jgi:hypothetical protein
MTLKFFAMSCAWTLFTAVPFLNTRGLLADAIGTTVGTAPTTVGAEQLGPPDMRLRGTA